MHVPSRLVLSGLLAAALLLAACGSGGGSSAPAVAAPAALAITTTSLPGGSAGTPYPSTQLLAANAQGALTWSVSAGSLPPGLDLSTSGVLDGTPSQSGAWPFTVQVQDATASDMQNLLIGIDTMAFAATSGTTAGDAWTNAPVTLSATGASGSVSFSILANESGGSYTATNGTAGTATWTPGPTGGSGTLDRLRATDAGGVAADLDLPVMPDPTATYTASFGTSDVWWLDGAVKKGGHAFASDLHAALADVGLRDPASTGATGTEADELAAAWFHVELRRKLYPMFLREADGSPGATGLAITFPFTEPGAGYAKPAPAGWLAGSPTRYSQMGFTTGSTTGVIGTAFLDGATNGSHENDTSAGTSELGVFANQITPVFNSTYSNVLPSAPVGPGDVDALKALLYDLPNPGGRYALIAYTGRGFARTVAAVVAHEVGHSLSLDHTSPPQTGSIMNPSAQIGPTATYAFTGDAVAALQAALPGQGKSTGPQTAQQKAAPFPEGGVRICHCRAHPGP